MKIGLSSLAGIALATLVVLGVRHIGGLPESVFVHKMQMNNGFTVEAESFEELAEELRQDSINFLNARLTWQGLEEPVTLTMAEMGATVDFDPLAATLLGFMENTNDLQKTLVYFMGRRLSYPVMIDETQMRHALEKTSVEFDAQDARFVWVEEELGIRAAQKGQAIDWTGLNELIQDAWQTGRVPDAAELPLIVLEPSIHAEDLTPYLEHAQAWSAKTLTLQNNYGEKWDFALADHLELLSITEDSETGESGLTLGEGFHDFAKEMWGEATHSERADAKIFYDEEGEIAFAGSARFGTELDTASLLTEVLAALEAEEPESILFPVHLEHPEVTVPEDLAALGITGLVGVGHSNFSGSPYNRVHNINVGMAIFNGTLLEPGEEFSFTSLMGPIDAAHGWLPELVILGDETKPEYGGGLCQVSSTMFRAALYSGLDITARKNHSYAVSYYAYPFGYGLDATIYDPLPDFKFINDTDGHLLIQGYTEGTEAYFIFYGTNDGRQVKMEGPVSYGYNSIAEPQVTYTDELAPGQRILDSYAHVGFKTDWWRTITYGDGSQSELEHYHSNYEARPTKYLEGKVEGVEYED